VTIRKKLPRARLRSRALACAAACALATSGVAFARVDTQCSSTTATTAIDGVVQDALGRPLQGIRVELYATNRNIPLPDFANTAADGTYRICVGQQSGGGYDTFDVHAREPASSAAPLYGTQSQAYSTMTNFTSDANFTPATGLPLLYMSNLTVTPNAISTAPGVRTPTGDVVVTFVARSKAPATTRFELTVGHLHDLKVTMTPDGAEGGGPDAGGWNRWTYASSIAHDSPENLYWAAARGFGGATGTTEIAQFDREPYTIDNSPPQLGPSDAAPEHCGPGIVAQPFTPATTTNPMPTITHGVCDTYAGGSRSGIDPFSLRGKMCRDSAMTTGCADIQPYLNTYTITWFPSQPLALGDYFFAWHIADYAGNVTDTPGRYRMTVVDHGGQIPFFTAITPGNLGSGTTAGVVAGSSLTTPPSLPMVGFRVFDNDGQRDLVPGTLRVRVYYGDERTLVYDYDAFKQKNEYDPITHKGGAAFDLSTGSFRAEGYPLQGKPPGRYLANASITDHGGNNASYTWQWVLAAAI
jgi:hypothetical protein